MKLDIPKIFKGKEVTIVGGCESLKNFDLSLLEKQNVIPINDAAKFVNSQLIVSLDERWHKKNKEFLNKYRGFLVTDRNTYRKEAKIIDYRQLFFNQKNLDWHMQAANLSGFVAVAVAFYLGANKVYLLGFDGGFNKRSHFNKNDRSCVSSDFERLNK